MIISRSILDEPRLQELVGVASNSLVGARRQAMRIRSASNVRQLGLVCHVWANEHKGEWPDDLASALKGQDVPAQVAENPSKPKTGYTYIKPPKDAKGTTTRIVIYESETDGDGRNVGFMDGHVQWMTEKQFQSALKAQQAAEKK